MTSEILRITGKPVGNNKKSGMTGRLLRREDSNE